MLTVLDTQGNTLPLDVDPSIELENIQALLEADFGIAPEHQLILFQGRVLSDVSKSLSSFGIKDGDLLIIKDKRLEDLSGKTKTEEDSDVEGPSYLEEMLRHQILQSASIQKDLRIVRSAE